MGSKGKKIQPSATHGWRGKSAYKISMVAQLMGTVHITRRQGIKLVSGLVFFPFASLSMRMSHLFYLASILFVYLCLSPSVCAFLFIFVSFCNFLSMWPLSFYIFVWEHFYFLLYFYPGLYSVFYSMCFCLCLFMFFYSCVFLVLLSLSFFPLFF